MRVHFGSHTNPDQLWRDIIANHPKIVAVDCETPSLKNREMLGTGIAVSPDDGFYVSEDEPDFYELMALLQDKDVCKVYHNALYDIRVLRPWGIDYTNTDDTAIMCRLMGKTGVLEENSQDVKTQSRNAGEVMAQHGVTTMDRLPDGEVALKCIEDCLATIQLYYKYKDQVPQQVYNLDRAVIPILEQVSQNGIGVDEERHQILTEHYQREYDYYKVIGDSMGFDPSKRFEVGFMLSEAGEFLPTTKKGQMLLTDETTLRGVKSPTAIPIAQMVLLFRKAQKMLGTYLRPLSGKDRAYTMLHMEAVTGRINGTNAGQNNPDRNILNFPKKADMKQPKHMQYRSIFVPYEYDDFTDSDASQIELRVLAFVSGDERMQQVFNSGGDIHLDTARGLWPDRPEAMREFAKVFNYAVSYNGDARTVAAGIESNDFNMVAAMMEKWHTTYPEASKWIQGQKEDGIRNGYVETTRGRKMWLPTDRGEKHAINCAINWPIQAEAAEIFKLAILECKELANQCRVYMHDGKLYEGQVDIPDLTDISPIHVPWDIEVKKRWSG